MGSQKHYLSLEQLFQGYVCYSRNKSSSKGDSRMTNRFDRKLSAMRAGCLGFKHCEGSHEIFLYLCKHGRLSLDQKFRNFRNGDKWYGNFLGKVPENTEIAEFPKSEPFNRKFRDKSQMKRKFPGKFFSKIWEYLTRLSSFSEFTQIPNFLLSASQFYWPRSQRAGHLMQG